MTTEMQGSEMIEPESAFDKRKYRVSYKCGKCGHLFAKTCAAVPKKDPPCPNRYCAEVSRVAELEASMARMEKMLAEQRAPAHIGDKVVVKAVDETAKIVMEDFGMTNLRDGIRPGENMAPKLPAPQQTAADNYFGGGGFAPHQIPSVTGVQGPGISAQQMNLLGRRAMSGAFRGMAVPPTVVRPNARTSDPVLTRVGVEQLRSK